MHEKMFSYLNIHRMKWFDLHVSLLNSHVSHLYWVVQLNPSTLSVNRFYFVVEGALVKFLEGAGFSFICIDPKFTIWYLTLHYCVF